MKLSLDACEIKRFPEQIPDSGDGRQIMFEQGDCWDNFDEKRGGYSVIRTTKQAWLEIFGSADNTIDTVFTGYEEGFGITARNFAVAEWFEGFVSWGGEVNRADDVFGCKTVCGHWLMIKILAGHYGNYFTDVTVMLSESELVEKMADNARGWWDDLNNREGDE